MLHVCWNNCCFLSKDLVETWTSAGAAGQWGQRGGAAGALSYLWP